jgi:transcriptional regulator with XRE-family HTH domain
MPDDSADAEGGLFGGPEAVITIGEMIAELRSGLGWSQGRLAEELGKASGHPSVTREYVSRWEHGRKTPGPFWTGHLSAVLQVPRWVLEGQVRRRDMLRLTGAAAAGAALGFGKPSLDSEELFAAVAAGDPGPLAQIQTTYATDLALARMAAADRPVMWRLAKWADDDASAIVRVNSAGIIGKAASQDFAGLPAAVMLRDQDVRARWLHALVGRVGKDPGKLSAEVLNPADSGARWCAGWLLAQDGSPASRQALARALRSEPVAENIRTFGLLLNGEKP